MKLQHALLLYQLMCGPELPSRCNAGQKPEKNKDTKAHGKRIAGETTKIATQSELALT